jgi:hypothetical protein
MIPFKERAIRSDLLIQDLWTGLQGETSILRLELDQFNIFRNRGRHQGLWQSGLYEFELKSTSSVEPASRERVDRTMGLLSHMSARREKGKGSGAAGSKNVEIILSVWFEGISRNMPITVPDRITLENLWPITVQVVRSGANNVTKKTGHPTN